MGIILLCEIKRYDLISGKINQTCQTWKGQECTVKYRSTSKSMIWEQQETGHSLFVVPCFPIPLFMCRRVLLGEAFTGTSSEKCKSEANLMPYLSSRTVEGLETLTSNTKQNGQDSLIPYFPFFLNSAVSV